MSQCFRAGDTVLWNPSNGVAQLFLRNVEAVAPLVDIPTGLGPARADEYEIDVATFTTFVGALVRRYRSSTHPILRSLIEAVTAVGIVLVDRAGGTVPSLAEEPAAMDMTDVAVFTTGFGAGGKSARLRQLADDLSRAMPR
jgi:hypothetical protein